MKFYRLEKTNYVKIWAMAILKSLGISLFICVALLVALGYKFMIVQSGSMSPTIPVGSLIMVTPCEYEDLQLGDIVTMHGTGYNLTHRIVGKRYNGVEVEPGDPHYDEGIWYTQGDANPGNPEDFVVTDRIIVGKVYESHCFTFTGTIVLYVKENYYMLLILAVVLIAFIEVLNWLKSNLESDDIECYELEDEE